MIVEFNLSTERWNNELTATSVSTCTPVFMKRGERRIAMIMNLDDVQVGLIGCMCHFLLPYPR